MKAAMILCSAALTVMSGIAFAQSSKTTLHVISIPGRPLAAVVAQRKGTFAKYGIDVEVEVASNSDVLRGKLAEGRAEIAHGAVDNAVALKDKSGTDVVIVLGGELSANELIAQPEIKSIGELRGHTLIVDAPNTAYALQLKKILLDKGLIAGRDYEMKAVGSTPQRLEAMRGNKQFAASILGPPTSMLAKEEGFVSLGSTQQLIGAYQAIGAFTRRDWASKHSDALIGYLTAYVEATRWLLDPPNKNDVLELLQDEWHVSPAVAASAYTLMGSGRWYEKDARFDFDGLGTVLRLRAELERKPGTAAAPDSYYDSSYYEKALLKLPQ